jgi:Ca-activated chloride channel family protein
VKFAEPMWLLGSLLAVVVAAFYVIGGLRALALTKRFGQPDLVARLLTARAGARRAVKGGLVVLAVALAFVALSGPQYGRGTRLIPATNLDCVIVLDYSKSMYARDVAPNRTERAKAEVAQLIADLPGTRFGAVAFAGEPLSFPLTSDGAAIAQFFRQTTPNDMPVGGTAIARALEAARDLLQRDPLSAKHQKVIVLVTDGEDLEGDPVAVAAAAAKDGTVVHVVQVGTRAPEVLPEVDELGQVKGIRRGEDGKPLTTSLTAEGEAQLTQIASAASGLLVQAEAGQTGLSEISKALKRLMTEELAERVETVYADIFYYPLGLAVLLLLVEVFIGTSPRRSRARLAQLGMLCALAVGCKDTEREVFSRYSPVVDRAVTAIDTHDAGDAHALLSEYLSTGRCKAGELGTPEQVRALPHAGFDLALALFELAERFGGKFGELPPAKEDAEASAKLASRSQQVDCALRLVRVIAADEDVPLELRARAHYLSGNLEFLRHDFKNAITSYDQALELMPGGTGDAGTELGTIAAFNRALALHLAEEEEKNKPPQPDAGPPQEPGDAGAPSDEGTDSEQSNSDDRSGDEPPDKNEEPEKNEEPKPEPSGSSNPEQPEPGNTGPEQSPPSPDPKSSAPEPPPTAPSGSGPSLSQDDRILDELERAPMFQHVDGKQRGRARVTLEDK